MYVAASPKSIGGVGITNIQFRTNALGEKWLWQDLFYFKNNITMRSLKNHHFSMQQNISIASVLAISTDGEIWKR
jgi:hypothetical protein